MLQTLKKLSNKCVQQIKQSKPQHKRVIAAATAAISITMGSAYVYSSNDDLKTVYHIYLQGERLGTVDNQSVVEDVIKQKLKKEEQSFDTYKLTAGDQVSYIPEKVFHPEFDNQVVINNIKEKFEVLAAAHAFTIKGEPVAFVKTLQEAENVLLELKKKYVSEEVLTQLNTSSDKDRELQLGDSIITDVRFDEKVTIKKENIFPNQILPVDQAVELLQKGTLEPKIHKVASGEILGRIANKYDLTVEDIIELNPKLSENSVLQIGDELVVTAYEPYLDVIVEEKSFKKEELPFETKVETSDQIYKGESRVTQEGRTGEQHVKYVTLRQNGIEVENNAIETKVISEPKEKIIVKGTKVIPSRGTGDLGWPAVGGYISSNMGYRWGKLHKGIDIARPSDRTIKAADNGTVEYAGWDGGYGNKVVINHNNGMKTVYAHLASLSVKKGQTVPRGTKLGVMGTTGNSTGIHLHFEVYKNGKLKNPMDYY